MGIIIGIQVALGTALILTGVGATVGMALVTESLNEVFQIM